MEEEDAIVMEDEKLIDDFEESENDTSQLYVICRVAVPSKEGLVSEPRPWLVLNKLEDECYPHSDPVNSAKFTLKRLRWKNMEFIILKVPRKHEPLVVAMAAKFGLTVSKVIPSVDQQPFPINGPNVRTMYDPK
jgi:hypothetical protein